MSGKPHASKGQKRIAEYISSTEKAVMTAVMLGRQCGVSESTVVRFAMQAWAPKELRKCRKSFAPRWSVSR